VRLLDTFDPRGANKNASIIAHVNVLQRMSAPSGTKAPTPAGAWPSDTYFTNDWALFVNDEAIELVHIPAAHTDGDTMAFFRRSDVISTGDIFSTTGYPRFDPEHGGSVAGILDGLNRILEIAIPGENQTGGTAIIPGHGRISDETEVANYRDMVTIVRDRVAALIKAGKTLEQVQSARPSSDYDGIYAGLGGPTPTDVRRGDLSRLEGNEAMSALERTGCSRSRSLRPASASPSRALSGATGPCSAGPPRRARARTDRSHGSMGGRDHRRLALADGDAARRGFREHSSEPEGNCSDEVLGLRERSSRGQFLQGVWAAGPHPPADALAHRLAGRDTLRLQFDAGNQTRMLHFAPQTAHERSLQGDSTAKWFRQTQSRGVFAANTPTTGGSLQVVTRNMTAGYLRPNGVPYGENATVKEYFNTFASPDVGAWLVVTTVVVDPDYLTTDLIMSTQFKKEANRSHWNPRACDIAPPLVEAARR
jgi:glyoxylase-like metal-dependent hydrolase (beta-lactamase superfamily II)